MDPAIKARWVQALRSGDYTQGRGVLRDDKNRYCCLGVLCDIAVQDGIIAPPEMKPATVSSRAVFAYGREKAYLPAEVRRWAGLGNAANPAVVVDGDNLSLANLNDNGYHFNEIAQKIEDSL